MSNNKNLEKAAESNKSLWEKQPLQSRGEEFNWTDFQFPLINNVNAKTIADEIVSAKPMTIEEAANGRSIRQYPFKYDSFASYEMLSDYIELRIYENKKIKAEWLRWETGFSIPINIRDDVYYKGHDFLQITCCEPRKDLLDDIVRGEVICKLNPNDWDIEKIKEIINNIKNR